MPINEAELEELIRNISYRQRQICLLLLDGCENDEIAKKLQMAKRTVKAHFNRLFLRFNITGGIKRVKLATLLYRRKECLQTFTDLENSEQKSIDLSSL